ncbi:hypothetical protein COV23_01390 [Candidatus Wolfebacteria bacterium CG10_big_fil_rev_8_21_14_0_10_31_9]|uniref:Phosphatidic acid phosphatase type 2/haloperoxidase domain-containing protein n=1 Tax=Candidatus Wolfebacteria bacterium CG10_big_fil_rev_8_21_14_0_10_31_9 TaxID=1975070 RepID=A0A2H0RCI9_9BACT|nr:MAG: hypothetical protein COV23_01390 [Candidatus Wolfebacteria bacterium CG10_big_fil_rev_8_21_14_0_10_31_9]
MQTFDISIFNFIHQFTGRILVIDWTAIFFAKYAMYALIFWGAILLLREKNWVKKYYAFAFGVLSVILSRGIIVEIIRFFYFKQRPFVVFGFDPLLSQSPLEASFPSGHTAFCFALILGAFYLNKKSGLWFLAISIIVGISRVYVGVHWPLDILAGAIIGILSGLFIKCILFRDSKKYSTSSLIKANGG